MISIFIRTILIYVILSILLKIMGKRQIGELEVEELVATLLISEIASISISDPDLPLLYSVVPILFIGALEITISALKNRFAAVKRVVEGRSVYIIFRGHLRQSVLDDNRISINELLTEMHIQGIGDIGEIYYAILEQNGKISLFKEEEKASVYHPLIIDGAIISEELSLLGFDGGYIDRRLREARVRANEVFLLAVNDEGRTNIILKEEKK